MSRRISFIIMLLGLVACNTASKQATELEKHSYLMDSSELLKAIERPHIKLLDFRKLAEYNSGHIPGALPIWRNDIEDHAYPYSGMMANQSQLESLLGNKGINSSDTIVIYDNNGLCNAARLWWIFQNYNFNQVKLLRGGIDAWDQVGGEVSTHTPEAKMTSFTFKSPPTMDLCMSKEEVQAAIGTGAVLLDTRSHDEYTGMRLKKGASKAGRIPGSKHIDWAAAIDYDGDKSIKSIDELKDIYSSLAPDTLTPIIVYCHTGVRSAHTTFVLTQLLGYKNVKNYDGSWSEWSYYDNLSLEQDSLTTILQ